MSSRRPSSWRARALTNSGCPCGPCTKNTPDGRWLTSACSMAVVRHLLLRRPAEDRPAGRADQGDFRVGQTARAGAAVQAGAVEHDGHVADELTVARFAGPVPADGGADQQGDAALGQEVTLQGS